MLQELTVDDFNNVNASINKNNLLLVYNTMYKNQEELGLINFYLDDNFYWDRRYTRLSNKRLKDMIKGDTIYKKFCPDIYKSLNQDKWKNFRIKFMHDYGNTYSFALNKTCVENYLQIIFNKLRPDKEYEDILAGEEGVVVIKRGESVSRPEGEALAAEIADYEINHSKYKAYMANNAYIYCIKVDGEMVYIGKTTRDLKKRVQEHMACCVDEKEKNSQQDYLYKAMRECKIGYKFEVLYESHGDISAFKLEQMEKELIEKHRPKYNYEGVKVPYKFSGLADKDLKDRMSFLQKQVEKGIIDQQTAWDLLGL